MPGPGHASSSASVLSQDPGAEAGDNWDQDSSEEKKSDYHRCEV